MPRVALDISQIDRHSLNAGQYRYAVDLVRELSRDPGEFEFLILGSLPEPAPELADVLRPGAPGMDYKTIQLAAGRASFYRDLWRYRQWLGANRVDLFHQLVHYLPPFKPCPYVVTHYDCVAQRVGDRGLLDSRPYRYYTWAIRRLADRVISISEASRVDGIRYLGLAPDRVITIPLGLSPSFAFDPAAVTREYAGPFLLAPFNLEPYKNLIGLVRALVAVLAGNPHLKLLLYGNSRAFGDRQEQFDSACRELGVEHAVQRLGFVSDERLRALYATADAFVFPTLIEGFGYPLLEAMACGACCVTTAGSAMEEVGGRAVHYADTRDPAALAAALNLLLADGALRRSLGSAARQRAAAFTVGRMAAQTLACYRDVLQGRGN